jgi:orotidine-5'-phosphate decarboxylase
MKPLIIALDVDTEREALGLLRATKKHADIYKVGPSLILRYGPSVLKKIRSAGKKVFLDLKFHDIPNTMERAVKEAAGTGVFSLTVHTSAGESAMKAVADVKKRPQIWGVTVLTSLSQADLDHIGFGRSPMDQAARLADLAKRSAIDGIVASVGETAALRQLLGPHFTIVTPGIRMPDGAAGDQKRVATPGHARFAGASFIVVGRPIIEARDPDELAAAIVADWKKGV